MKRNEDGTYQPGVIYELRCKIEDSWHPFYVGETINKATRLGQHQTSAKHAGEESTLVYRFIHDYLDANKIEWDLFEIDQYGEEGPEALEDEHIMRLLVDNVALKNTKKGNANWMTERMAVADDMRSRKITSYRRYKEVLTYEEQERKVNEANAERVALELARQQREQERQEQLTKQELIREQVRQQMIEQAKVLAEQAKIKLEQENQARLAREEAQRLAWEADAPARALRLQQQAEELERREQERELLRAQKAKELEEEQRREQEELERQQAKRKAEREAGIARAMPNIIAHEEKMKLVKQQEDEHMKKVRERMEKILRVAK